MKRQNVNKTTATITLFFLVGGALLLSSCNTTKGFGNDVEALGESISDAAESTD